MLTEVYLIFLICLLGAGIGSFILGKKEGIKGTIEYLIDEGLIEVED